MANKVWAKLPKSLSDWDDVLEGVKVCILCNIESSMQHSIDKKLIQYTEEVVFGDLLDDLMTGSSLQSLSYAI